MGSRGALIVGVFGLAMLAWIASAHADYQPTVLVPTGTNSQPCSDGANGELGRVGGLALAANALIVADLGCHSIRSVGLTGAPTMSTVAGASGTGTCGSTDGTLLAATFAQGSVGNFAFEPSTNQLWLPDAGPSDPCASVTNQLIRFVALDANQIATFAGTLGQKGSSDAPAKFADPEGTTVDRTHNAIYVADTANHLIRQIDLSSKVTTTILGTGSPGSGPNQLNRPRAVALHPDGRLYICDDGNHRILRREHDDVTITTVRTNVGCAAMAFDTHGNLYISDDTANLIWKLNGQNQILAIAAAGVVSPSGIAASSDGKQIFFGNKAGTAIEKLVKTSGAPTAVAGPNQTVFEGQTVRLSGLRSSDSDNDTLSFKWTQTGGPTITFDDPTSPTPTFLAPAFGNLVSVQLTVTDDDGITSGSPELNIVSVERDQDHFRWLTSTGVASAAADVAPIVPAGTLLHLRIGAHLNGDGAWALQSRSPKGQQLNGTGGETVSGTLANLASSDDVRETLGEGNANGAFQLGPDNWTFNNPPAGPAYDLCFEGATAPGETFLLGFSPGTASPIFPWAWPFRTEIQVAFDMGEAGYRGGAVKIWVEDSSQASGAKDTTLDSLAIDLLQIQPQQANLGLERDSTSGFQAPVQVTGNELWSDAHDGSVVNARQLGLPGTVLQVDIEARPSRLDHQTDMTSAEGEWDFSVVAPATRGDHFYRIVATDHTGTRVSQIDHVTLAARLAVSVCGDKIAEGSEVCDTGSADTPACNSDCTAAACGDGKVNAAAGEACDEGSANSNAPDATCRTDCTAPRCGDGIVDTGEVCDPPAPGHCSADCLSDEKCGNGITDPGEACDDGPGNSNESDAACRTSCVARACGDGIVDPAHGESCDDGNTVNGDGCSATCVTDTCGDGVVDTGEDCDTAGSDTATCNGGTCTRPACGDHYLNPAAGEECDDGNTVSGDGCSATCQLFTNGVMDGYDLGGGCAGCGAGGAGGSVWLAGLGLLVLRRRRR